MRLQDIMRTDVRTIGRDESAEVAWARMREYRIRHLVVTEGRNIVGVISERDLGGVRGASVRRNQTVADLMTENPFTVEPSTTIREAANLMRGRSIGCLPVVEKKKVVGIITTADMLELLGRHALALAGNAGKTRWKAVRASTRHPHVSLPH